MSTYAELDRQLPLARPLYLELRALGLDLRAGEDPQETDRLLRRGAGPSLAFGGPRG